MFKLIRDLAPPETRDRGIDPVRMAKAVAWAFFGVRASHGLDSDTGGITPLQAIAAGVLGAGALVVSLLTIVQIVVS
jgi:hypothetical protein